MDIKDLNGHLKSPEGYALNAMAAEGSYLRADYRKLTSVPEGVMVDVVMIYLNDTGREVLRTSNSYMEFCITKYTPPPQTRWQQFSQAFAVALSGLREMVTCLKWW